MDKGEENAERIADMQSTSSKSIIYFTKTSTTEMVKPVHPRLEIPIAFVRQHGDKFCENIILERFGYGDETWLVALTIQNTEFGALRVLSRYPDWQKFAIANRISRGDILLFNLISMSRFVVHVNPDIDEIHASQNSSFTTFQQSTNACSCFESVFNCKEVSRWKRADVLDYLLKPTEDLLCDHHGQFDEEEPSRKSARFKPYRRLVEDPQRGTMSQPQVKDSNARNSQIREQHLYPSPSSKLGPGFVKTLCNTHVSGHKRLPCYGAKMEVPYKFVREYGNQIHKIITLEFQNSRVTLVNRGIIHETASKKDRLTFGVGWSSFCDDNNLHAGDRLQFTLVQPSHFFVQLLYGKRSLGLQA